MDIAIQTHDEFLRDRVTIRITGTSGEAEAVAGELTGGDHRSCAAHVSELEEQLDTAQQAREIETGRANDLAARLRSVSEELGRRFTVAQMTAAKAGVRADERARLEREIKGRINRPGAQDAMTAEGDSERAAELVRIIADLHDIVATPF